MRIRRSALEELTRHARESQPRECCGILMSRREDPATVSFSLRGTNTETEFPEQRYALDRVAHLKALDLEYDEGATIIGYYHSHPESSATPSQVDREQAVPGVTYVIIGLEGDTVSHTVWRLDGDEVVCEPLEVSD